MSFLIHPELSRIAMRQGLELTFVVWSILMDSVRVEKSSSHFTKESARQIAANQGLKFTLRHWRRIWNQGREIFWRTDNHMVFIRSFRRVASKFKPFISQKDLQVQERPFFVKIALSGGMEDLRANLYWAWFMQFEEKTISRATITDLFGLSPDQQRSYEALLGNRLLIKTNYAHINADSYSENPHGLPEHHFTVKYEREVRFDEDIDSVTAIQYQMPNTFLARQSESGVSPVHFGFNRARKAIRTLVRDTSTLTPQKRTYWLKWSEFEKLGSLDSFIRAYFQGKKRLWLLGQFL